MNDVIVISLQSLTATSAAGGGKLTYQLASHLHKMGRLNSLIVSSKGKFSAPFPCKPVSAFSRFYLRILNGLLKRGLVKYYRKRFIEEMIFDYFLQFRIDQSCRILISINPYLPRTLKKCRRLNIATVLIPTNPEENEINEQLANARKVWNVNQFETDAYTYKPRLDVYNNVVDKFDKIIAYTSVIESTFRRRHSSVKSILPCLSLSWAMQPVISKSAIERRGFKVVYIAHTVLLKGLQDLLQAWEIVGTSDCELHIGGVIDSVVGGIIKDKFQGLKNVSYHGHISNVNEFIGGASLLVCPSLLDAGPATPLEAAANKIPTLLTDSCGAIDVFEDKVSALFVPASNPQKLAEALNACIRKEYDLRNMGIAASEALGKQDQQKFIQSLASLAT
jgi:glycosyltransferase involved in cell wall biosynthesis